MHYIRVKSNSMTEVQIQRGKGVVQNFQLLTKNLFLIFFKDLCILFERERVSTGGRSRERGKESLKQIPSRAWSPSWDSVLWPWYRDLNRNRVRCLTDCATQVPQLIRDFLRWTTAVVKLSWHSNVCGIYLREQYHSYLLKYNRNYIFVTKTSQILDVNF